MKHAKSLLILMSVILTACAAAAGDPTGSPVETISTAEPVAPSPTAAPTQEPVPVRTISYYQIQIEYTVTSDWATIDFVDPSAVMTAWVSSVTGSPTTARAEITTRADVNDIELSRPFEALGDEPSVSMNIEILINPESIGQALEILSRHGGVGGSGIKIYTVQDGEKILLQEIDHFGQNPDYPGYNDTMFEIDLSSLASHDPQQFEIEEKIADKMVWAFYYPWIAWDLQSPCTDHPASAYQDTFADGSNLLRDISTLAYQIDLAISAGIDGFLVSYVKNEILDQNLDRLLTAAQTRDFKIAIYLESTPDPNDRSVKPNMIIDTLQYVITKAQTRDAYMKVGGKPLVVIYNSSAAPLQVWRDIFDTLETQNLAAEYIGMSYDPAELSEFVGLHQYAINDLPDLAELYKSVSSAVNLYPLISGAGQQKIFAATVQPGFNSCPYEPENPTVIDRQETQYYRSAWEAAIQSDPDWIFITTWNEYGETTHIEPSQWYGTQYLDITREYIQLWKGE